MSVAKQEQPAQGEQSKPQPVVGGHHLDNLQSMLNLVFLQSGRFVKEHQAGGGTGRMKLGMQRAVPVAAERFQDSLDQLENEIRNAQVVLRRDLALLKQDRKRKLEAAAKQQEAEKARLAAASKTAESTVPKDEMQIDEKVSTPAQPEAPTADKEPERPSEPEEAPKKEEDSIPAPIDTKAEPAEERDPLFDGTPTTANPADNEFDFDAIFGDAMEASGDNQNDMMDTSGDMTFNFDEEPSLLPGLEDFAKSGEGDTTAQDPTNLDIDMAMSDLPDLNTNNDTTAPAEQPAATTTATTTTKAEEPAAPTTTTTTTTQPAAEPATTEVAEKNETTANDANNDDPMDMMVTDNFDDLFNMDDEYPNPEASAFDDAFFDFGN